MSIYNLNNANMPQTLQANDILKYSALSKKNIILPPGSYKLECWGAAGGDIARFSAYGGKGGYATGVLTISDNLSLFLVPGGQGVSGDSGGTGGFNGGGFSNQYGGGGGGASDIRLKNDTLNARIIVAGGGGGSGWSNTQGGTGGGLNGSAGSNGSGVGGQGASQTNGGNNNITGAFGVGGNTSYGGGGGGGWFGGASGQSSGTDSAGGGGSGWTYTGQNNANFDQNLLSYKLTQTSMNNGVRDGNGEIQITVLSTKISAIYVKISSSEWKKLGS